MAEDPNKAQEEAKRKQEEQRRLQEEAKTRESNAKIAEQARQQAVESQKKSGGSNDIGGEAQAQNRAVAEPGRGEKPKTEYSFSTDPYAESIRGRSFRQGVEADTARDIRRQADANLQRDAEYLRGAFGLKPDMLGRQAGAEQIIKSLEKQTGITAGEGTAGLGQYSDRDLAKYMSNPQVKSFVDNLKSGTQQIREIAPEAKPARPGEPGYQTDFQQRVAQYKETTKGNRLDTSRATPAQTTAQRVDPLQPMGGQIMGGIPKMGGGVYGPGGYGAENVMTNRPAKTQQELEQRMAKVEASKGQNITSSIARTMKPKGAYLPSGEFIANQPKPQSGMETDEQRIARREKELGVGRFASQPSYFDDKSRGRRII